jgi:hypothetical protein
MGKKKLKWNRLRLAGKRAKIGTLNQADKSPFERGNVWILQGI